MHTMLVFCFTDRIVRAQRHVIGESYVQRLITGKAEPVSIRIRYTYFVMQMGQATCFSGASLMLQY